MLYRKFSQTVSRYLPLFTTLMEVNIIYAEHFMRNVTVNLHNKNDLSKVQVGYFYREIELTYRRQRIITHLFKLFLKRPMVGGSLAGGGGRSGALGGKRPCPMIISVQESTVI